MTGVAWAIAGLVILGFLFFVRKSGKDAVEKQHAEANVKAAERIAKAVADAPSTHDATLDRLRSDRKL